MRLNITGLLDLTQRPPPLGLDALSPITSAYFKWLPEHLPFGDGTAAVALPAVYLALCALLRTSLPSPLPTPHRHCDALAAVSPAVTSDCERRASL